MMINNNNKNTSMSLTRDMIESEYTFESTFDDHHDLFYVTFKLNLPSLGLRLAPRGGNADAVFDGWVEGKQHEGENHEMLQIGDRLVGVNDIFFRVDEDFEVISSIIQSETERMRYEIEQEEKKEEEQRRKKDAEKRVEIQYLHTEQMNKYNLKATTVANVAKRMTLKFSKPKNKQKVKIVQENMVLNIWFRPVDNLMYGGKFLGFSNECTHMVRELFKDVKPGQILLSLNDRSVEGLKFDVVLDAITQSNLPLKLCFADEDNTISQDQKKKGIVELHVEGKGNHEQEDDDNLSTTSSVMDFYKDDDEEAKTLDPIMEAKLARKLELSHNVDAFHRILNIPMGINHLLNFFRSIEEGDRTYFTNRIASGQDLAARDQFGRTALLVAAATKNKEDAVWFCKYLLKQGIDIDAYDYVNQRTALHIAASSGNVELIRILNYAEIDLDAEDRMGRTALFDAVINCRMDAIKCLLNFGASANLVEYESGWNVLHFAALGGRTDIIECILDMGKISIHLETNPGPFYAPRTSIEIAREAGNEDASIYFHQRIMSEPLHRVWPDGGPWVIEEDDIQAPDLLWRNNSDFTKLHEKSTTDRATAANQIRKFRKFRPHGNHDVKVEVENESKLIQQVDRSKRGELWIGSKEALEKFWIQEQKQIDTLIIFTNKEGEEAYQKKGILGGGDDDLSINIFTPIPKNFKEFASKFLARVVKLISAEMNRKKRILVVSDDAGMESQLQLATVVVITTLIIKENEKLDTLLYDIGQRCYFFSKEHAKAKSEWLYDGKKDETCTVDKLNQITLRHDCRKITRTEISKKWIAGLNELQEQKYQKTLKNSRARAAKFASTFIM